MRDTASIHVGKTFGFSKNIWFPSWLKEKNIYIIYAKYVIGKGYVLRVYKEVPKYNNKKTKFKQWINIQTQMLSKLIYKCQVSIVKGTQLLGHQKN